MKISFSEHDMTRIWALVAASGREDWADALCETAWDYAVTMQSICLDGHQAKLSDGTTYMLRQDEPGGPIVLEASGGSIDLMSDMIWGRGKAST